MTESETSDLLGMLVVFWPDRKVDRAQIKAWHMVLDDVPYPDMTRAVKRYLKTEHAFFPQPGQLIAMIADEAAEELRDETAWSEVQKEIRRVGYRPTGYFHNGVHVDPPQVEWSHPLIEQAVNETGWKALCLTEGASAQAEVQKKFFWTLKDLKERAKTQVKLNQPTALGSSDTIELGAGA